MTEATYICEGCGSVQPGPCADCDADTGYSVAQIKDAIRACPTIADVNDTARHFGVHVAMLDRAGDSARTMAIQIRNLAKMRRRELAR